MVGKGRNGNRGVEKDVRNFLRGADLSPTLSLRFVCW